MPPDKLGQQSTNNLTSIIYNRTNIGSPLEQTKESIALREAIFENITNKPSFETYRGHIKSQISKKAIKEVIDLYSKMGIPLNEIQIGKINQKLKQYATDLELNKKTEQLAEILTSNEFRRIGITESQFNVIKQSYMPLDSEYPEEGYINEAQLNNGIQTELINNNPIVIYGYWGGIKQIEQRPNIIKADTLDRIAMDRLSLMFNEVKDNDFNISPWIIFSSAPIMFNHINKTSSEFKTLIEKSKTYYSQIKNMANKRSINIITSEDLIRFHAFIFGNQKLTELINNIHNKISYIQNNIHLIKYLDSVVSKHCSIGNNKRSSWLTEKMIISNLKYEITSDEPLLSDSTYTNTTLGMLESYSKSDQSGLMPDQYVLEYISQRLGDKLNNKEQYTKGKQLGARSILYDWALTEMMADITLNPINWSFLDPIVLTAVNNSKVATLPLCSLETGCNLRPWFNSKYEYKQWSKRTSKNVINQQRDIQNLMRCKKLNDTLKNQLAKSNKLKYFIKLSKKGYQNKLIANILLQWIKELETGHITSVISLTEIEQILKLREKGIISKGAIKIIIKELSINHQEIKNIVSNHMDIDKHAYKKMLEYALKITDSMTKNLGEKTTSHNTLKLTKDIEQIIKQFAEIRKETETINEMNDILIDINTLINKRHKQKNKVGQIIEQLQLTKITGTELKQLITNMDDNFKMIMKTYYTQVDPDEVKKIINSRKHN